MVDVGSARGVQGWSSGFGRRALAMASGRSSSDRLGSERTEHAPIDVAEAGPGWPDPKPPPLVDDRLSALYEAHAESLMRFLMKLTFGNRPASEDMLQETLLRAWQNIDKIPADPTSLRPWLFTVARRVSIDANRAKHARPIEVTMTDKVREPIGPDLSDQVTSIHTIRSVLPHLTPEHRAILVELYYRGSTTREAAHNLGIPEGTVKSRAHYALRSLSSLIGQPDEA